MLPETIQSLVLDMDGVLWKADSPIGDLPEIFARIAARGLSVAFATNNGSRTPDQYVERLAGFGVTIEPEQVITASLALASLLREALPPGAAVFAVGGDGLMVALHEQGYELLPIEQASQAQAVVMGLDRQITYEKMSEAALLVSSGVPFYATNPDKTYPTPRGEIPGAGAWISVVQTATGRDPLFAGKPAPHMLELARLRLGTGKAQTLVVGDRLETDLAGGQAAGMPVALVLSGVSDLQAGRAWNPPVDLIARDLTELVG